MPALPLIGRDHELKRFGDELKIVGVAGTGCAILVSGEAGIGKTHFLTEAVPPELTLVKMSFPNARFAAPGSGLRRLAEVGGSAGEALEEELAETSSAIGGWKLLSICQRADDLVEAHPGKIIVFDDLQWADELTLAWLSRSAHLFESETAMVLAVRSSDHLPLRILDAVAPLRRAGVLRSLELGPLSASEVGELARTFGLESKATLATTLHRRTNGLPLAVEELLREALRRGTDLDRSDAFLNLGISPSDSVLAGVVREQASSLDREALDVLMIITLMPAPAKEDAVWAVADIDRAGFDSSLEAVMETGFISRTDDGRLRFRHELQREALQGQLGMAKRRSYHERIAAALEEGLWYPAGKIAEQFIQAGRTSKALEWLERASVEAAHAHDHGNALSYLAEAIRLCPAGEQETRTRLAERCVLAARSSNQPSAGAELVEEALAATTDRRHRGRLLLGLTRLVSFFGDYEARAAALTEARECLTGAGDDAAMARVLGEFALPAGKTPSIGERIALGREGLALAERSGDPAAISLCAANLAVAELRSGNPAAFGLWARAAEVDQRNTAVEHGEEIIRNRTNWAIGALDYGFYDEAHRVLTEGERLWANPFWKEFFHCLKALHLWRTGLWDAALREAGRAREGVSRPEVAAMASAIETAITFERSGRPDVAPLVSSVAALLEMGDEQWGAVAQSMLIRIRAARREPQPERGLHSLLNLITNTGVRIGWDDLLPAAAEISPVLFRRTTALLGSVEPAGARAEVSSLFAKGLVALHENEGDAQGLLLEAARSYEKLPDPYFTAKALQAAAQARARTGRRAGEERVRAAEIYRDIGADRSLARLLRQSGNTRALDGFHIPRTQAHAGAPGLTSREEEVADLARQGYTAREMSERLGIAHTTVKKHLERVKAKLGVRRKSDLIRILSTERTSV